MHGNDGVLTAPGVIESPPAPAPELPSPGGGFSGLLNLVKTRPWSLAAASLLASLSALMGLVPALLVYGIATQILSNTPDLQAILTYAIIGVVAAFLKMTLFAISTSLAHIAAFGILYDIQRALALKLARVPLGLFNRKKVGALHKAMNDDVRALEAFLAHLFPDGIAALTAPFGAMIMMFWVDWRMTLASFIAVPIALIFQLSMLRGVNKDAFERYHEVVEATKEAVHEYLRGMHVVKTFGLEAHSFAKLRHASQAMTDYVEDYARRSAPSMVSAMKMVSGGTNALFIVPVGLWLYHQGELDMATFVFFLVISTQVLSPFLRIANGLGQLNLLMKGADHIQSILDESELEQSPNAQSPSSGPIAFKGVDFSYDQTPVLEGISFEANRGSITAIVGPSGAGKSTLVKLMARFWDVDRGSITVDGVDIRQLDLDQWLAQISFVFQDVFLFHGTVYENLRLAHPEATPAQIQAACQAARIHDTIMALPDGYETQLGERGARLSGGERQRLSIARAFLKNTPILILDEATAFADPQSESLIQDALETLSQGKTIFVIAHKLSTIQGADQILVLDKGQLQGYGNHQELIENCPVYQRLWQAFNASQGWVLAKGKYND